MRKRIDRTEFVDALYAGPEHADLYENNMNPLRWFLLAREQVLLDKIESTHALIAELEAEQVVINKARADLDALGSLLGVESKL